MSLEYFLHQIDEENARQARTQRAGGSVGVSPGASSDETNLDSVGNSDALSAGGWEARGAGGKSYRRSLLHVTERSKLLKEQEAAKAARARASLPRSGEQSRDRSRDQSRDLLDEEDMDVTERNGMGDVDGEGRSESVCEGYSSGWDDDEIDELVTRACAALFALRDALLPWAFGERGRPEENWKVAVSGACLLGFVFLLSSASSRRI